MPNNRVYQFYCMLLVNIMYSKGTPKGSSKIYIYIDTQIFEFEHS